MNTDKPATQWTIAAKNGKKWERRSSLGFKKKESAVRFYQNTLIFGLPDGTRVELRKMKVEFSE